MAFDPDAYLAGGGEFNPDQYLAGSQFNPDEYLQGGAEPTVGNTILGIASSLPFGLAKSAQGIKGAFGQWTGDDAMAQEAVAARKQLEAEQAKVQPKFESPVAQGIYGGVESTLQAVPALAAGTLNPLLGLGLLGAQTGGEAYGKYQARGATKEEAALGGLGEAGVEMVTEKIPMGFILNKFGTATGAKDFLIGLLARELPTEQAATLAQDAIDTAIANPNKTWTQYLEERPNAALQTALATVVQGGLMAGGSAVTQRIAPKPTNEPEAVQANLDALDAAKEELRLTQGDGTMFVGPTGDVTAELPTKITESPEQLDLARTEMQNQLQQQATATEEGPQGELFPEQAQLDLGLQTQPTTQEPVAPNAATGQTGEVITPDESGATNRLANIQSLPSYDKQTGEFNPVEYIQQMRDTHVEGQHRAYKTVYDMLLKALNKMPESARPRFALDIDVLTGKPKETSEDRTGSGAPNAAAQYDPNTDVIWIGRQGETEGTIVHETIHALTSRVLHFYKPTHTMVKGLYNIFNSVKNDPAFKGQYGTTDIHEFLAEAFSSPAFQARLAQHQVKGLATKAKNALNAIVKEIVKVLGYRSTDPDTRIFTNALEEIIAQTEVVVDSYAENKAFFDKAWPEKYPASRSVPGLPGRSNQTEASVNLVTNGAVAATKAAQSPPTITTPETTAAEQMEKISGEIYIPETPTIDDALINKIKGEPDGSSTWNLTPGALARSELAKSTLVKTIYRLMNGAYKKAEYKINQYVKPAQESFLSIMRSPTNAKISHGILMREMKNGKDYSAEELHQAGVPDKIVKAHIQFRLMMQQALEAQNVALQNKGLPKISALDAYISSRWSGPYRANIVDTEGNVVWQVAEHSKSTANDAVAYILKKDPTLKADPVKYRKGMEKGDSAEAGYLDLLKLLDPSDPRVATLESIYKEFLVGRTEDIGSQEKHHLRKKGVQGFAGTRKWAENDVRDFFVQQFAYAENAFRWSEAQKSMEGVKELLNNKELQDTQKNNIQYSKEYVKNQLGFGTNEVWESIDNGLAEALGTSPQKLQEYMGAAKSFFYLTKLGLSLPFTVTQFLQPAITTPAFHAQLNQIGYKHNPIVTILRSFGGGASAAIWHYGQYFNSPELSKTAEVVMSPLEKEAARYMEANGVVDINPMTDIKKGLRPKAVSMLAAPFEFTIKHSEVVARSTAFMGFVSHLEQSGKYDTSSAQGRLDLFQKAEDMTNLSMTDYRSQERALVFEKMGLTGDAAATLHAYQLNNLMQLVKFSKEAKDGNVLPLFYMVAMQGMAAGLAGLWFLDDMDDLLDNLKKLMPHDQYMKVKDFSLKSTIAKNLPDWAAYGLVSQATGTDIHTRMNASSQIPVWPFESKEDPMKNIMGLFPFAETALDTGMGIAAAVSPGSSPSERAAGMLQAAPVVAQGPLENKLDGSGMAMDKTRTTGKYRRTEEEKGLRNLGLRSTKEREKVSQEFQLSKVERELQRRMGNESNKSMDFIISGDFTRGVEHLIKYDQLGGDPAQFLERLDDAKIKRLTTELQRRAIAAQGQSKSSILKLQRYLNTVGK